jgi:hypothetical protein
MPKPSQLLQSDVESTQEFFLKQSLYPLIAIAFFDKL